MSGVEFSFQDTGAGDSSGSRAWIAIAVFVTLATVGVILLVRAFGEKDGAKDEAGQPAAEETAGTPSATPRTPGGAAPAARAPSPADMREASETALAFMRAGEAAEKADDLYAARTNYLAALADPGCGNARPVAEARLGAVDIDLIFSPRRMEGKVDYAIAPGDSLKKIANRHGTTVDLIVKGNSVPNPDRVQVGDRLRVRWGRSGHCIGSVWFRFRVGDKTILFSGDYTEHSLAYRCDRLRDIRADIAVLDCAYGRDDGDGKTLKNAFRGRMKELAAEDGPLMFPVPAHGRGADVIRELAACRVRTAADPGLCAEIQNPEYRRWLRKSFREDLQGISFANPEKTVQALADAEDRRAGILVRDSQLRDEGNREMTDRVLGAGGHIVLTGKQDPASYARLLLKSGRAEFDRIPVHQNTADMEKLMRTNRFRFVIPYHCRQELSFDDRRVLTVRTGDTVRF